MFDPKKFTTQAAKPLPVVLLLDVSGSMYGEKIQSLNQAVKEMISNFANEEQMETEIHVSVITFGSDVSLNIPYTKASNIEWIDLQSNGATPMGSAISMAKAMIEDKETTPSRAYRPTIILVSDGAPTDSWQEPLRSFVSDGRSSKCDRMAMGIGAGADTSVLNAFIAGTENPLFEAKDAKDLQKFFKFVTMSVTTRTRSKNPNLLPEPSLILSESDVEFLPLTHEDTNSSSESYW